MLNKSWGRTSASNGYYNPVTYNGTEMVIFNSFTTLITNYILTTIIIPVGEVRLV